MLFLISCNQSIDSEKLYGKWKYLKVENPNHNPPDSLTAREIAEQSPFIEFSKTGDLSIIWDGKALSNGKFRIEGNLIRYTESLPGGTKREFPFLVSELSDQDLIFETMQEDGTRVTAKKIN